MCLKPTLITSLFIRRQSDQHNKQTRTDPDWVINQSRAVRCPAAAPARPVGRQVG